MEKIILFLFILFASIIYANDISNLFINYSDTSKINSSFSGDSLSNKKDSLKKDITPKIVQRFLSDSFINSILRKEELNYLDYRYTGNFISYMPFGFLKDLGSVGQPNEILLYGQGYNNSTYFVDGININNRLFNSFDLNLFQSESIDSIEIIPITRGFLYGINNNSASINFISKDFSVSMPYTRIKFYQAPNEEGMIDGIFSSNFGKRLSIFTEITNQSTNPNYRNSDFGVWLGNFKARYILSKDFTFITNYQYSKSNVQLNGGVNTDSIKIAYPLNQFEEVLYNNISAPVKFYNRYQKVTFHNLYLRLLGNLISNSPTDFSVYYQTSLIEFRQNDTTNKNFQTNVSKIFHNNEYRTLGLRLRQDFAFSNFHLSSINEIEQNKFISPLILSEKQFTSYLSSLIFSSHLFNSLVDISIFGKYLNYDKKKYLGIGGDFFLNLSSSFKIYFGASAFQKPRSAIENKFLLTTEKQTNNILETKFSFTSDLAKIQIGYFNYSIFNRLISAIIITDSLISDETVYFGKDNLKLQGLNLNFNFKLWKILINSNSSLYFSKDGRIKFGLPELTSNGGIFYIDTLFSSNLKLKSGFNYWIVGKRNSVSIDFEKSISTPYNWFLSPYVKSIPFIPSDEYPANLQLDFFAAGKIQERAIVYFVFENILNTKYFIVPYFPKQERGIRFGVAWEFFD